jgi:ABC-type amino acid transport substrate-binding protein
MATTIQNILDAVTAETTSISSLQAFIAGLKQQLADALAAAGTLTPAQQAALDQVFSTVTANSAAIVAAQQANVPPGP